MKSKRMLVNLISYSFGQLAIKFIVFLLVPVYTRYLSNTEYGMYDLINTIIILASPLLFQNIWEAILRFVIISKDSDRPIKYIYAAIKYSLLVSIPIFVVSFVTSIILSNFIYTMVVLLIILQSLASIWLYSARALGKNKLFIIVSSTSTLVMVITTVPLLVFTNINIYSILIGLALTSIVQILLIEIRLRFLKQAIFYQKNYIVLKEMLIYSIPLMLNSIAWWMQQSMNRFVIIWKLGIEQNGIYAITLKFLFFFTFFTSIFSMAWQEEANYIVKENNEKIVKDSYKHVVSLSLVTISIILPLILLVFPWVTNYQTDYNSIIIIMPLLLLNSAIVFMVTYWGNYIMAKSDSKSIFVSTIIGALSGLILSFFFITYIGLIGIAIANIIGTIVTYVLRIKTLKKYRININHLDYKIIQYLILFSFVSFLSIRFMNNTITLLIISAFCVFVFLFDNRDFLKNLYTSLLKVKS